MVDLLVFALVPSVCEVDDDRSHDASEISNSNNVDAVSNFTNGLLLFPYFNTPLNVLCPGAPGPVHDTSPGAPWLIVRTLSVLHLCVIHLATGALAIHPHGRILGFATTTFPGGVVHHH